MSNDDKTQVVNKERAGVASAVLVVSDDAASRLELATTLRATNMRVEVASSIAEGLSHLRGQSVALAVCDLSQPDNANIAFLTACIAIDANLPVIVVTDDPSHLNINKAQHLRVRGYLAKPLNKVRLFGLAQQAIGMRKIQLSRVLARRADAGGGDRRDKAVNATLSTTPIVDVVAKSIWGYEVAVGERSGSMEPSVYSKALRQLVAERIAQCPPGKLIMLPCTTRDFLSGDLSQPDGPLEQFTDRIVFAVEANQDLISAAGDLKSEFAVIRRLSFRIMMGSFLDSEATCFAFNMLRPDFLSINSAALNSTRIASQRTIDLTCQYAELANAPIRITGVSCQTDEDIAKESGFSKFQGCHVDFKYLRAAF